MGIHSIHHVQLGYPAGLEADIRHFYTQLMGLTELKFPAGPVLRFAASGQRVDLVPAQEAPASAPVSHLAFEVQGLPQLRSRLLAADLALEENEPLPGYLRFYVRDPAGNRLELLEPDLEAEASFI